MDAPSAREAKSAQLRQHIFDTALDLFCEVGYKETTLVAIAEAAEVSTRTLHRYFPNKGAILKHFCKENIFSLKEYARTLPASMSTREQVEAIMIKDFTYMFCLFDTTYIMHMARDEHGVYDRSEIDNISETESIYQKIFVREQIRRGMEPNSNTIVCSSVVMAIYRHCSDVYRFRSKGEFVEEDLRRLFSAHLDIAWNGIETALASTDILLDTPKLKLIYSLTDSLLETS